MPVQYANSFGDADDLTPQSLFDPFLSGLNLFDSAEFNEPTIRLPYVGEFDYEADSYYAKNQFTTDSGITSSSWFDESIAIPNFAVSSRVGEFDSADEIHQAFSEELDILGW